MLFGKKKKSERERARREELAAAAERRLDELTEMAARELRAPLVRMQKLLQESLAPARDAEKTRGALENLLGEIVEYKKVIDDLFIIARTNLYKEPGLFVPIDLSAATREAAEKFREPAAAKKIAFDLDIQENLTFPAHAPYYRKLVGILLDNAVKYTPEGGRVALSLKREKNKLALLVQDTGEGMTEEEIPKALQRFHRLEKSRRDGIPGHGLGLTIAQWIAGLHQGKFEITSMSGKGTRVRVELSLEN